MKQSEQRLREIFGGYFKTVEKASPLDQMLYVDAKVWLPDDLLIKADKMTMANGLELRVPFLDHKLVEFAATLPNASKIRGKGGKTLLRSAMRGVLPDAIIDRPKKGFPSPDRVLAPHVLATVHARPSAGPGFGLQPLRRSRRNGPAGARARAGSADRSQEIWTLLVFEFWHRHFIENHPRPADAQTQRPLFEAQQAS